MYLNKRDIDKVGGRRCSSSSTQHRCYSAGRKARHSYRRTRYHQRRPAARVFTPYNFIYFLFSFQAASFRHDFSTLLFLCRKVSWGRESPMSPSKWLFPTKRAAADGPARVPSTAATVPKERPGIRTGVHATTRDDQLTAFGLIVVVREECAR